MLAVHKLLFLSLIAFQFFTTTVSAEEKLRADLIPLGLRPRNEAPIPVEAKFTWDSTRLLEGRLDMEFREGQRVLGHYRSGEMVLSGGEQRFRLLLPALPAPVADQQVEVQLRFVTRERTVELDPVILSMPTANQRTLTVGWFEAAYALGRAPMGIEQKFALEKFAPTDEGSARQLLFTSVVRRTADELPAQPLGYTSFDVVMLSAEAFRAAHERQLAALARWVRGGGSVCVFVEGKLEAQQIAFLNQLSEGDDGGPRFACDSEGNLLPPAKEILSQHSGVGRSVIVTAKKLDDERLEIPWRAAVAFLWKLRADQSHLLVTTGRWTPNIIDPGAKGPIQEDATSYQEYYTGSPPFASQPSPLGGELMNLLMPRTVRLIPFSALLTVFLLFIVLIGPADYFVLGLLRRRKLTWVLFPLTSLAFTLAMVLMANHYLGLRDQRRSLTVVDLASDGTALRWNRYELVFAARDKNSVTELKDALWTPLKADAGEMPMQYLPPNSWRRPYSPYPTRYPNSPYAQSISWEDVVASYDGTIPARFNGGIHLQQWRPQLTRVFSLENPPAPLPANWREIESAWPNIPAIRTKLSAMKGFNGEVFAIFNGQRANAANNVPEPVADILEKMCYATKSGLFNLVSQVSPTGGSSFEDAPAMDRRQDSALVIVTHAGDDFIAYRRFFYGN